ncbi:MAG: histidine phosphatase family protein [Pseudomonadota bacterium]
MTLTLLIMRHTKSSWGDASLDDFDRPLNGRGRKSAVAVGQWLRGRGYVPGDVVVSGARRTVDTWGLMAGQFPGVPMRSEPALYEAGAETILGVVRRCNQTVTMIIGHNPGFAAFSRRIVKAPPSHEKFGDYPTGATLAVRFGVADWSEVTWETGHAIDFVVPRELI